MKNLENIEVDKASDVLEVFETLGFEHSLDSEQSLVVNQMFVKSIESFASSLMKSLGCLFSIIEARPQNSML